MPTKLRAQAAKAKARHQKRPIVADVDVSVSEQGWDYGNPYSTDEMGWLALFLEPFGTRMESVGHVFVNHLARLCTPVLDEGTRRLAPNEHELRTAIAIVRSLSPRNEAEAALAAQAVALHFASMKMGRQIAETTYPHPRSVASLAAVSKAFAGHLETMQKLKGRKTARQRITVRYERHNHNHQHVHFEGGGGPNYGGQPVEPCDDRNCGNGAGNTIEGHASGPALPRPDSSGVVVPMPRKQGKEPVPETRGRQGVRRSEG